jgi:hypothetical protein
MRTLLAPMVLAGAIFLLPGMIKAQSQQRSRTLMIDGQTGHAAVRDVEGRDYVAVEDLTRITHGSLRYEADTIILNIHTSNGTRSTVEPVVEQTPHPVDDSALSRDFIRAAIEEIASTREWASTLAYAIQNGYQVTDSWAANYREQTAHNLALASTAAITGGDRNAAQLLTKEFEAVRDWSNRLVQEKKSMDTAKYALAPNALRDDPQSQKIINCGRFLAQMLGSGKFADDPSCH